MTKKNTANIILNGERLKVFALKLEIRQRYLLSPLLFNIVLKVLARAIRQEIKDIQTRKVNKYNYTYSQNGMILHTENPKESIKKTIRVNKFCNIKE